MTLAKMTSKGQVTIPKNIRDQAHLIIGVQLDFRVDDGQIIAVPVTAELSSLRGLVKTRRRKPVSLKTMKAAIRKRAAKGNE